MKNFKYATLVTGGSKRIGKAISRKLASENKNVIIHYNKSKKEAVNLCKELSKNNEIISISIHADLNEPKEIIKIFNFLKKKSIIVNCLINNASSFNYDNLSQVTNSSWNKHINPNLYAPIILSKEFAKKLPKGITGNIINIIDQRVLNLTPHFLSYTVSKSGLWTVTKTLALELAPKIRVNAIGPGPTIKSKFQTEKEFKFQCKSLPLQYGAKPEEVAETVLFLLKVKSITGQLIALDGGQHLGWGQVGKNKKVLD
ncbi:MAG: Glucose 1-dehydrogenase 4 [Alphaproteobacteria bacterium MarineAlpha9_Bin4]|nr:short chain dehydrogenase [Pelagibacterales bacterium]PPR26293.1 MAG: Glucose 1-dehydrogenase 4 [Alphaproteobacteria bacterium MarineAlpha9_Bin4]